MEKKGYKYILTLIDKQINMRSRKKIYGYEETQIILFVV